MKAGIKSKRLICGWNHDYPLRVLSKGDYDAIALTGSAGSRILHSSLRR